MEDDELENFFTDETVAEPEAPEAAPEPAPEVSEGPARDESGRFAKREEKGVENPAEPEVAAQEPVVPTEQPLPKEEYQALKAERQKRQEIQQQLEAAQQQLARQQQQVQPKEVPDFWDDPNAHFDMRLEQFGSQLMQQFEQQQQARQVAASFDAAKAQHDDFDAVLNEFTRLEQINPTLTRQALASGDPGSFVYQTVQRSREVAQYGSIDGLLAAERAKWEAEARAAIPRPKLPQSTALDGTVGARGAAPPPSEFSLDAVFDD